MPQLVATVLLAIVAASGCNDATPDDVSGSRAALAAPTDVRTTIESGIATLDAELAPVTDPEARCRIRDARMRALTSAVLDVAPGAAPPRAEISELRERILLSPEAQTDTEAALRDRVAAGAHYEPTPADLAVAAELSRTRTVTRGAR